MDRRDFLKKGTTGGGFGCGRHVAAPARQGRRRWGESTKPIPRRKLGKTGEELSIVGFGGIVVMNNSQSFANNIVAEAVDRGINYFDVAPSYGDAQARLGPALEPYRKNVFLACKEEDWTKDGCAKLLEESLRLLRTDHVDLYQFHGLTKMAELDQIFGPNGAMETFEAAAKQARCDSSASRRIRWKWLSPPWTASTLTPFCFPLTSSFSHKRTSDLRS